MSGPAASHAGRLALVTGASRGIGRVIAIELAARGADVAVHYLRNGRMRLRRRGRGGRGARATRRRARRQDRHPGALPRPGRGRGGGARGLDLLVANAATGINRPALDLLEKHWQHTLGVNAASLLYLAQRLAPLAAARGGGSIAALSSLGSQRVLANYTSVGVSKAALEALVRYLAVELAPQGIRVNAVSGGVVDTDALRHFENGAEMLQAGLERTPLGRIAEPQDMAAAVAFLTGPESRVITGQTLIVDGGYSLPG